MLKRPKRLKALKPGSKGKKASASKHEETKEVVKASKHKIITDVSEDSLNSYEDFVGHLGDWQEPLADYLATPHFKQIYEYVKQEYDSTLCFPPKELIFNAFKKANFKDVKVVIVGQDPYIKVNEAMGLCFSIPKTTKCPPSLKNIYKALNKDKKVDFKTPSPVHGDLQSWADQGILMLNAALTVRAGKSFSHAKSGWLKFTNEVIKAINKEKEGIVFLCWGGKALDICKQVDTSKHHVLKHGHPSPLAQKFQKFEECTHFSETNDILVKQGLEPIDWNLK
ncbi:unnamed protein product [Moneuplotes crassus]|uniref:Uracil-DNA glycosylase n=1 Tax=Euplotes crassus TaxID=5936 RepID=A0AAD1XP41_EUPCR|nr:unnamed protein product [Moneuplotes crassus]